MLHLPENIAVNKKNIIEYLAREILSGTLKHNDTIPNEIECATCFGVSRTMIRDVLKILEMKGLIERRTNVGTRVRSINSWNLLDHDLLDWSRGILTGSRFLLSLMELRLVIEPQAAALAAIRANDKNLLQIRDNFSLMLPENSRSKKATLDNEADIAFHKSILKACGNLFLSQFGSAIQGALHHTIYKSNMIHIDHKFSYECHRRVLVAIEDRNPEGAYVAMCSVLHNAISDLQLKVSGVILTDFGEKVEVSS